MRAHGLLPHLLGSTLLVLAACGDDTSGSGGSGGSTATAGGDDAATTSTSTADGAGGGNAGAGGSAAAPVEPEGPSELFGSPLGPDVLFVPFDTLVAEPGAYAGQNLQTLGAVRANCTKRGCWMEVRSPENEASVGVTVRFVDYGFFIPSTRAAPS